MMSQLGLWLMHTWCKVWWLPQVQQQHLWVRLLLLRLGLMHQMVVWQLVDLGHP
jgi:hypothetical protein